MTPFDDRICDLGEGPLWHPLRGQFFWFDILGRRLLSREAGLPLDWRFDRMASAAGWVDRDRLIVATETGLALLDLTRGVLQMLAEVEADQPDTRSNDGRADRQGGFWFGTMGKQAQQGRGAIYRWYRGDLRRLVSGITIPNAICFSADGRSAHYADTRQGRVWRLDLDAAGWPQGAPRPYLDLRGDGLNPDGAVIDAEGALCLACWGAGRVIRFDPSGGRLDEVAVGGLHSSCPALGGADLRDMLVTTAREGIADPDPAQGLPWLVRAPAPGLPEPQVLL
ncbi:SMP-30/gluconolactonase/LRE family protein [Paracoccus spongiarum]|uniref:SMP-30/gluconolactonase/LRE family protein n=1 Tax=Paracoccus spongiarum TaxID=3064387 RepID=A0ABT9J7T7_9RHOB|nr:SMP-30/gluconolactonase/LRE family protein [Paracoccus sp. 2205BS29-5]MDP5305861.1 SMP-30/gluconolactonase/LRE family protein [Paracoccus sp. 2205BS29-5]